MITLTKKQPYTFFLGGQDLEMAEIASLLKSNGRYPVHDKKLKWGAKASSYSREITEALDNEEVPVLIELEIDLEWLSDQTTDAVVIIDHHNAKAGSDKPTSLEQVFSLLDLPSEAWTRRMALVAANDRGHIRAMRTMGATKLEMEDIRRSDRSIQGVTHQDERQAAKDLQNGTKIENCLVAKTALTSSTAIADLFTISRETQTDNLLIIMPEQSAFYGSGQVIMQLAKRVEGSWFGGELPTTGFWGSYNTDEAFLLKIILAESDR